MKVLEVRDITGRIIHLTSERLKHIQKRPEMSQPIDIIQNTTIRPTKITSSEIDESVRYYYRHHKRASKAQFLKVVIKYLNGNGYIITAFFTNRIT